MIERTIVLPLTDNDGNPTTDTVNNFKQLLFSIAGGFSESQQVGYWKDADTGIVYRDESIRVVTTVTPEQDTQIAFLLPYLCEAMHQVCLYTHTVEVNASFVEPSPANAVTVTA